MLPAQLEFVLRPVHAVEFRLPQAIVTLPSLSLAVFPFHVEYHRDAENDQPDEEAQIDGVAGIIPGSTNA